MILFDIIGGIFKFFLNIIAGALKFILIIILLILGVYYFSEIKNFIINII